MPGLYSDDLRMIAVDKVQAGADALLTVKKRFDNNPLTGSLDWRACRAAAG